MATRADKPWEHVSKEEIRSYLRAQHWRVTKASQAKAKLKIMAAKREQYKRFIRGKDSAGSDSSAPWIVAYGICQLGGNVTFIHMTDDNQYIHLIVTIASHELTKIRKVFFDGTELGWSTALSTRPTALITATGVFAGYVSMQINYGSDSQAALTAPVANCPASGAFTGWTTNHRQRGHAHAYFKLKWNELLWKNGLPEITFEVQGKYGMYDPRTGSTLDGSLNPAMCLWDYMTNTRYGLGIPTASMNVPRASAAMDTCDEVVTINSGTEPRYNMSGYFTAEDSPGDVIQNILISMAGKLTYTQGYWNIYAGEHQSSSVALDENDLLGPIRVITKTPLTDSFNAVRGTYVSSQANYDEDDFPLVKNTTYITEDNGETVYEDVTYEFVTSPVQPQRLAKIDLERIRQGITIEFTAKMRAYKAEPVDTFTMTNTLLGWSSKLFEVVSSSLIIEEDPSGVPYFAVKMVARETASTVYDWNNGEETTVDPAPNTNLPNPRTVADPTSLGLESGTSHLYLRADGTVFSRLYVYWTAPADAFVTSGGNIELQYKKSADSVWQDATPVPGNSTSSYILDVQDRVSYDVRIRSVNALKNRGNWVTATGHTVVGKTALPSDVTGFTGSLQGFGIKLYWTAISDLDVREYELRIGSTGDAWAAMTPITKVRITNFYYELKTAGTYRVRIKAIDTTGNYSTNDAYVDLVVANPGTPSISTAFEGENYTLSWPAPSSTFSIAEYEIRYGASYAAGTFVATVTALRFSKKVDFSGSRTYWVAARDVARNTGTAGSVSVSVTALSAPTVTSSFDGENVLLAWTVPTGSLPAKQYEIRYGADYATGTVVAKVDALRYKVRGEWSGARSYFVAAIDSADNTGSDGTVAVTITAPAAPTVTSSFDGENILLAWTLPSGSLPVKQYEIRYGADYATGTVVAKVDALRYKVRGEWSGARSYFVAAIDSADNTGSDGTVAVTITAPAAPTVTSSFDGENILLAWTLPSGSLPVKQYEIRYGADYATGTVVAKVDALRYKVRGEWSGARSYFVAAIDSADNTGSDGTVAVTITVPGAVAALRGWQIDNTVCIDWDVPATGSLPVAKYLITKAVDSSTSTQLGTVDGTFFTYIEVVGNTYIYTVVAIDTAGNQGSSTSLTLKVLDPVNFKLQALRRCRFSDVTAASNVWWDKSFETNPSVTGGRYILDVDPNTDLRSPDDIRIANIPVSVDDQWVTHFTNNGVTTIQGLIDAGYTNWLDPGTVAPTWADHFTAKSYTTFQDFIDNGYTYYWQPSRSSGYFDWTYDFGTIIGQTIVSMEAMCFTAVNGLNYTQVAPYGATITSYLYWKANSGDGWSGGESTVNVLSDTNLAGSIRQRKNASNVRYVRMRVEVTPLNDRSVASIGVPVIQIDSKQVTDSGMATIPGAGYLDVLFTKSFTDVDSINVSPLFKNDATKDPLRAIYDFTDIASPTGFRIYLYDKNGNAIAGTVSWTVVGTAAVAS